MEKPFRTHKSNDLEKILFVRPCQSMSSASEARRFFMRLSNWAPCHLREKIPISLIGIEQLPIHQHVFNIFRSKTLLIILE